MSCLSAADFLVGAMHGPTMRNRAWIEGGAATGEVQDNVRLDERPLRAAPDWSFRCLGPFARVTRPESRVRSLVWAAFS